MDYRSGKWVKFVATVIGNQNTRASLLILMFHLNRVLSLCCRSGKEADHRIEDTLLEIRFDIARERVAVPAAVGVSMHFDCSRSMMSIARIRWRMREFHGLGVTWSHQNRCPHCSA